MALVPKLQVRQAQSLVITPQLMQAIRLLQMTGPELDRFVASEVEQNPLLERQTGPAEHESDQRGAERAATHGASPHPMQRTGALSSARGAVRTGDHAGLGVADGFAAHESLVESLERRIEAGMAANPFDRAIAAALLSELDDAGYLTSSVHAIAARLGAAPSAVERVLRRCQDIAPTGVFARSLAECLALQLAERNRLDPAMQTLLDNLEALASGDRAGLCLRCGVDREDLDDMIAEIRALDPKPGLAVDREPVNALPPDVLVRAGPEGWSVELNEDVFPRVLVDRVYHAAVSRRAKAEEDRRFIADCLQKANWLERSLDQRARSVLRVATEIVRRQEGFFLHGVSGLRPLNLRTVADSLGIHESTVSRAAANKTLATPRGIFEFRFFFTGAIPATAGGDAHSAESVKHRIRRMISEEAPEGVLSDDAIVLRLSRDGIEIARRTVAKYRELMGIGSSVERRRQLRRRAAS